MLDLGPIKARALAPQTAEFAVNAVDDIDALVEEVERLRRQHEIDQARLLRWMARRCDGAKEV